jgi:hypothetical protein
MNRGFDSINSTVDNASDGLQKTLLLIDKRHREDRVEMQNKSETERAEMRELINSQFEKSNNLIESAIETKTKVDSTLTTINQVLMGQVPISRKDEKTWQEMKKEMEKN